MNTWRHNQVLKVLKEVSRRRKEVSAVANTIRSPIVMPVISFCREGAALTSITPRKSNLKLLNGANDWQVSEDFGFILSFLQHIVFTLSRPDIVLRSEAVKKVVELTVPWSGFLGHEENVEETYEKA